MDNTLSGLDVNDIAEMRKDKREQYIAGIITHKDYQKWLGSLGLPASEIQSILLEEGALRTQSAIQELITDRHVEKKIKR